jgi:SAM-dependent methyltransferase
MGTDARMYAPATVRNREPILAVLRRVLPQSGLVLEVASGTGEHIAHFASALPGLTFQPTEFDAERRASVDSWAAGLRNVRPAVALDAMALVWPVEQANAIFCANMIHIAPWEATLGLLAGAGRVLPPGGVLVLYGPYQRGGAHTAESNAAFDADLRMRDACWGVRDLDDVARVAAGVALVLEEVVEMPANNLIVVFRRG